MLSSTSCCDSTAAHDAREPASQNCGRQCSSVVSPAAHAPHTLHDTPTSQLQRAGQEDAERAAAHHHIVLWCCPQLLAALAHKLGPGAPHRLCAQVPPSNVGTLQCFVRCGTAGAQRCAWYGGHGRGLPFIRLAGKWTAQVLQHSQAMQRAGRAGKQTRCRCFRCPDPRHSPCAPAAWFCSI